jgi:hypothetical protein
MMKLVYYPSFFWLRGRGSKVGMIGATIIVFFVTWITHSYQWFWLRGGFPIEVQDALFWGILGVLVIYGSLRELNRPKQRTVKQKSGINFALILKTLATFCAICFRWSLWSADSMISWLTMFIVSPAFLDFLAGSNGDCFWWDSDLYYRPIVACPRGSEITALLSTTSSLFERSAARNVGPWQYRFLH